MENVQRLCKLCYNNINNGEDYKVIEDDINYMFEVILLKLTYNECLDVLCNVCYSELVAAFKFKSTCLDTHNIVMSYVDFENPTLVDLKNIYAKHRGINQGSNALDGQEICRLCFHPTGSKNKPLPEVPFECIQMYIPEINFLVTTNPTICTECFNALQTHSTFIQKWSEKEEKVNVFETKFCDTLSMNSYIKPEELEIKSEEIDEQKPVEIFCHDIKKEEKEEGDTSLILNGLMGIEDTKIESGVCETYHLSRKDSSELQICKREPETSQGGNFLLENDGIDKNNVNLKNKGPLRIYKCDKCDYKTIKRAHLLTHRLKHEDPSEVRMYRCKDCDYKTVHRSNLGKHQLKHKDRTELPAYKCEKCNYTTIRKGNLKQHQSKHTDFLQVEMYSCDECHYKCLYKSALDRHKLKHKDLLPVEMYKCDKCDYETVKRAYLLTHQLKHKDPSEVKMYTCDDCDYETVHKSNLEKHQVTHKDPSELQVYKCEKCSYTTTKKGNLKQHHSKHADLSQVEMYSCNECQYKCLYKSTLYRHQLTHKDPKQIQLYRCDVCGYKSINEGNLKQHQLRHKDPSQLQVDSTQLQMHRCDKCNLETCEGNCEIVNANETGAV